MKVWLGLFLFKTRLLFSELYSPLKYSVYSIQLRSIGIKACALINLTSLMEGNVTSYIMDQTKRDGMI